MNLQYWFIVSNDSLVTDAATQSPILTITQIQPIKEFLKHQHFLGNINNTDIYCAELTHIEAMPTPLSTLPLRKALDIISDEWYITAVKAHGIINWDKNHQFCGRCGNPTKHDSHLFERICIACGQVFYPRISPSVVGLIYRGNQILMARSPHFTKGAYGLIAGFVEPGESAEAALHREIAEEVSISIKQPHYFGSQAWPFPDSLMLAYIAEYSHGDIVIDGKEIECADWYDFDKLPGRPSTRSSLSSKLIDYFIATQRN